MDPAVVDAIVRTEHRMRAEQDRQGAAIVKLSQENDRMRQLVKRVGIFLDSRKFLEGDPDEFWMQFAEVKEVHEAVRDLLP